MKSLARRIKRLVTILFSDVQQREAARQIGITHSLLSRTLSGEREPSKTLVNKLAEGPGVNPRWLLDGIGEPLSDGYGTTLPEITKLPHKLGKPWEELTSESERFRISENQYSDTRYWYRVTKDSLKKWGEEAEKRIRLQPGDYVLLETDPRQIKSLPGKTRLVVASVPEFQRGKPGWGILTSRGQFFPFANLESEKPESKIERTSKQRPRRKIKNLNQDSNQSPPKHTAKTTSVGLSEETRTETTESFSVQSEQVMAVALEMTSNSLLTL